VQVAREKTFTGGNNMKFDSKAERLKKKKKKVFLNKKMKSNIICIEKIMKYLK